MDRQKTRDRYIDRQVDRFTQTGKIHREIEEWSERQTGEIDKQGERYLDRSMDRQTGKTDRQSDGWQFEGIL